jgi:DNA-binding transcriptional ArsR family regulator
VNLDLLFRALSDPTRRRLLDELVERDGQTLFELHVRLISWHAEGLSRQALSKHLGALEEAGLIRIEWVWRSKHHFLERAPVRSVWKLWLSGIVRTPARKGVPKLESRRRERTGR